MSPEVHKDALGGLRSKEAYAIASWAYSCPEHEVEGKRLGNVVLRIWSLDFIFSQLLAKLCCTHVIEPAQSLFDSLHT